MFPKIVPTPPKSRGDLQPLDPAVGDAFYWKAVDIPTPQPGTSGDKRGQPEYNSRESMEILSRYIMPKLSLMLNQLRERLPTEALMSREEFRANFYVDHTERFCAHKEFVRVLDFTFDTVLRSLKKHGLKTSPTKVKSCGSRIPVYNGSQTPSDKSSDVMTNESPGSPCSGIPLLSKKTKVNLRSFASSPASRESGLTKDSSSCSSGSTGASSERSDKDDLPLGMEACVFKPKGAVVLTPVTVEIPLKEASRGAAGPSGHVVTKLYHDSCDALAQNKRDAPLGFKYPFQWRRPEGAAEEDYMEVPCRPITSVPAKVAYNVPAKEEPPRKPETPAQKKKYVTSDEKVEKMKEDFAKRKMREQLKKKRDEEAAQEKRQKKLNEENRRKAIKANVARQRIEEQEALRRAVAEKDARKKAKMDAAMAEVREQHRRKHNTGRFGNPVKTGRAGRPTSAASGYSQQGGKRAKVVNLSADSMLGKQQIHFPPIDQRRH